jgi:hypothetical protein
MLSLALALPCHIDNWTVRVAEITFLYVCLIRDLPVELQCGPSHYAGGNRTTPQHLGPRDLTLPTWWNTMHMSSKEIGRLMLKYDWFIRLSWRPCIALLHLAAKN